MKYRVTVWKISGGGRVDEIIEVVADRYDRDGSSYTFFRDDAPIATYSPVSQVVVDEEAIDESRDALVDELNNVMDDLSPLLKEKDKNKGVLLHQFINETADATSIRALIDRLDEYRRYLKAGGT